MFVVVFFIEFMIILLIGYNGLWMVMVFDFGGGKVNIIFLFIGEIFVIFIWVMFDVFSVVFFVVIMVIVWFGEEVVKRGVFVVVVVNFD